MNLKERIVRNLGDLIGSNMGWIRHVLDKAATKEFQSKVPHSETARVSWPLNLWGGKNIKMGNGFFILPDARIDCIDFYNGQRFSPELVIGDGVTLNFRCHIGCINRIVIGNHVLIGSNVLITDHSHGLFVEDEKDIPWSKRKLFSKGPVIIEDNVWIGENVSILPGVSIGRGSVIGANSVVTHDIPPYSMAVGIPAKVIKSL